MSSAMNNQRRSSTSKNSHNHGTVRHDNRSTSRPKAHHHRSSSSTSKANNNNNTHQGHHVKESAAPEGTPSRPPNVHHTTSQMDTRYVNMLLAVDGIPRIHNMFASFSTWILLAGFVLFPGTFTSLQNINAQNTVEQRLVNAVTQIPLFVIAFICCGIGAAGMCYLWWRWRNNYIWLVNQVFLPGLLNSLAGVLSTIANVFGVQHGEFSTTGKVTIIVTTITAGVCGILTLFYSLWMLRRVKREHDKIVGKERVGKHGEGIVEQIKRKANEKEIKPGIV